MAELLTPKQKSAIERAKRSPDLQGFLFRKANGVRWFNAFKEAGFLLPTEMPQPVPAKEEGYVSIPVWPITDYLVAASEQLLEPNNEIYAVEFMDFIRSATRHAQERNFGNYRVWWQFSKIIRNIPPHLISANDLVLINYWLDDKYERGLVAESLGEHWLICLLDRNDEHCRSLSLGLLQSLYRVQFLDSRYGESNRKEARLHFDSWHARNLTKKVAGRVGKVLGQSAVEVFRNQLEHIIVTLNNDKWSSLWRSSIGDHEQNHKADDAEVIFVEGFRDALLAYVGEEKDAAKAYVVEALDSLFETTRRIAINAVDQCYQQLNDLIGRVILERHFTSNFRHEMWHLLHNHYPVFSLQEKTLVQGVITGLVVQDDNDQQREGASVYQRAIWLSAIKDYGDVEGKLYRECIEITGGEPEHPDFSSYMTGGWVDHKSAISKEQLLSWDSDELVNQLNAYLESYIPPRIFDGPDLEGLTKTLRQVVKAEPLRFHNQLQKYLSLGIPYIHEIIEAYRELWSEKAQLPWDEIWSALLGFCRDIVNQDRLWLQENIKERSSFVANRYWIVSDIGRLIESGTKADEHAFSEKLLNQAEEVISILLKKEKGEEFKVDSDSVMVAINSPRGHCIEALVNLTLRSCRLADKQFGNHEAVWTHFQPIYAAELARAEIGEYEFATLVANYLPNFLYMSKEWVLANLGNIFDKNNYQKWLSAMNGYAYVGTVYEEIYKHLKENGHLIRALDDENIKERVAEKIIQNIAVAYVNDFENLGDESSLLHILLVRRNYQELSQLIWFLWTLRKDGNEHNHAKIFELWPRLLKVIDSNSREGKKLASKLCDWSVFVDEVNEGNKHLILAVAPFAEEDYNSHDLLESIARISAKQPSEAYEIWLRLLEGSSSDFPEEAIKSALTNLVQAGSEGQRKAKDVASRYFKGGNERPSQWLREITESVQNS